MEDGKLRVAPLDSVDSIAPAGGIASNVTDLARWLVCRLDSGRYSGGRLFSERQAREMWSGQTILPIADPPPPLAALRANFAEYALGWRVRDYQGRKLVSHTKSEEHTSELQSRLHLVCRLLLEKKKYN